MSNKKRFILLTTVPTFYLDEEEFDFYEYTYFDYSQIILYDIDAKHIIFDEDTGHDNPWAHYEYFIDGLHYVDAVVEVSFAYAELPEHQDYLKAEQIHEVFAKENYIEVEA